jgi:hypothetical protein
MNINTNCAWKILAAGTIASLALVGWMSAPIDVKAQETTDKTEYPYCWQSQEYSGNRGWRNQSSWQGNRGYRWQGSGGWHHRSQYSRMYDLNSIETISGEVISIDTFSPFNGMSQGIHLQVNTGKETVDVHLGPAWYLENQDISIEPKDKIEITGSRINFTGEPAIIAAEIKKGDATLILRDENGFTVWSGWRRYDLQNQN